MRKNLFLQSFKHLEKQTEEKSQNVNSFVFEKEQIPEETSSESEIEEIESKSKKAFRSELH